MHKLNVPKMICELPFLARDLKINYVNSSMLQLIKLKEALEENPENVELADSQDEGEERNKANDEEKEEKLNGNLTNHQRRLMKQLKENSLMQMYNELVNSPLEGDDVLEISYAKMKTPSLKFSSKPNLRAHLVKKSNEFFIVRTKID